MPRKKLERGNCSYCSRELTKRGRTCYRCGKTTCHRTGCGVYSIPEITGENQVWICQLCVAEGIGYIFNALDEFNVDDKDDK